MRHEAEIKRARDVLGNILHLNDFDTSTEKALLVASYDALCWALGHDSKISPNAILFDRLIRGLQQGMADSGYRIPDQNLPHSN